MAFMNYFLIFKNLTYILIITWVISVWSNFIVKMKKKK